MGASVLGSQALEFTEMTLDPPVSEDYAPLRAMALLRAYEAPAGGSTAPHEERDRRRGRRDRPRQPGR
jgi:hypothetical protein